MKKYAGYLAGMALMALAAAPLVATADSPSAMWDIKSNFKVVFTCMSGCSGNYTHTANITSENLITGAFSGTGYYNTDPSYTWNISGTVGQNTINFHILYTGSGAGYTVDASGTIPFNGKIQGTAVSNAEQTFKFTFDRPAYLTFADGNQLNVGTCLRGTKLKSTDAIINATQNVINDADSGQNGYWAKDAYQRHFLVWDLTPSSTEAHQFCALVLYQGGFGAQSGQRSPGADNVILATTTIKGNMNGGYQARFSGTRKTTPLWPTNGSVASSSTDYTCDLLGNCTVINWTNQYFDGVSNFIQPWWGWIYRAGAHGNWANIISGNFGDIH